MDKVEGKEDKQPARVCWCVYLCVWMCGVCLFTGDFPAAWRQEKQEVINSAPTYLASVWGSGPEEGSCAPLRRSITDRQLGIFRRGHAANERDPEIRRPLVRFCRRLA